ncbi:ABC transporter permease [Neobacillus sp. LXY-4]|uniref:ABC transporter permease n=1 Tax=Neobacillus sp. LXY-4 TaxID=3379826 RepID=UPI003EE0E563
MTFRQFAFNNVARNKRVYIGHFLSSTFAVIIFFTFGLIAYHPALKGNITEISSTMNTLGKGGFKVSQYIIYIFSIFFILYSVSSFLKKRKKEFGILMILGLSPRQFNRLVFFENIIIGITATVVGIGFGLVFSKLILLISATVLTLDKGLPFYFPLKAIVTTGIAFIVLFLLISLFTSKTVRVTRLVELIKSEEKPKPAPKASILLSILALLFIGAGYGVVFYFANHIKHVGPEEFFGTIGAGVGLVIAGTYFLFTQLSVYLLKALQQRELLFFFKTNMLSISDLIYRIKDNSITFFLVAIISAVAFTAIGTSAAVGDVLLSQLDKTFAIKYESTVKNPLEQKHLSEINKQLNDANIQYTSMSTSYKTLETRQQIMKLSDYNKYAKKLGYKPLVLSGDRAAVVIKSFVRTDAPKKGSTVTLINNSTVTIDRVVTNKYYSDYFYGMVIDDSLYTNINIVQGPDGSANTDEQHRHGFIIKDWQETREVSEKLATLLKYDQDHPDYYVGFLSLEWQFMKQLNGIFSILTVLVGIVFFVFASSFLYFRLFTDLEKDQEKYSMLSKLGITKKELNRVVTQEMAVLFFLPFIVAVIHSSVAYVALQQLVVRTVGPISLVHNSIIVLASFLSFHIIYFFIMRRTYLTQLYRTI